MNSPVCALLVAGLAAAGFSGCSTAPASSENVATTGTASNQSQASATSGALVTGAWKPLFNGKDLTGWTETKFGGSGEPTVEAGQIKIPMGASLSGINWTNVASLPQSNYEIELEAMKVDGNDFFCGLTFPVAKTFCTFVVGGWGGSVVGISSIDGADASENETAKNLYFEPKRWFRIGVRVTDDRITAKIDGDTVVDVVTTGKKITLRHGEIDLSKPLGIATYQTTAAIRNVRIRELKAN